MTFALVASILIAMALSADVALAREDSTRSGG